MNWLGWLAIVAAIVALFVAWDLLFCGGKRCKGMIDRL